MTRSAGHHAGSRADPRRPRRDGPAPGICASRCGDDPDIVLGVVHVKQAFAVPGPDRVAALLRDHVQQVPTVPSLDGDARMTTLRGSGLQLAVVVDEYGGVAGIVTLEDVLRRSSGTSTTSTTALNRPVCAPSAGTPGSSPGCCAATRS